MFHISFSKTVPVHLSILTGFFNKAGSFYQQYFIWLDLYLKTVWEIYWANNAETYTELNEAFKMNLLQNSYQLLTSLWKQLPASNISVTYMILESGFWNLYYRTILYLWILILSYICKYRVNNADLVAVCVSLPGKSVNRNNSNKK